MSCKCVFACQNIETCEKSESICKCIFTIDSKTNTQYANISAHSTLLCVLRVQ